jgi:hypothetical protein
MKGMATRQMQPQPWIKARVRELGKTLTGLGKAMGGLDGARITEIMAGTRRVQPQEAIAMARYLELPYADVYARLYGSVPSISGDVRDARAVSVEQARTTLRIFPARDLGGGIVEISPDTAAIALPDGSSVPAPFRCYVTTDHMSPAYEVGDDLEIDPTLPVTDGSDVVLISAEQGTVVNATLRRLVSKSGNHWKVKQWNPVATEHLPISKWRAFRVRGVIRKG